MSDGGSDRPKYGDPFYFSDSIRDIDEAAPFIRLQWFQQQRALVAVLCIDAASGVESLCSGWVKRTDYDVLEITTLDGRDCTISIRNADFYPLERNDAPAQLTAITTAAYDFGMRFNTGKLKGYFLAERVI